MRRSDREIKDTDKIIDILSECDVCVLGLNDNERGVPYLLPLNFGFEQTDEGLFLYFHGAAEGRKYELIAQNPMASFEADCSHTLFSDSEKGYCTMNYRSIIGSGKIELIDKADDKLRALQLITDHYHKTHFEFNPAALHRTKVMRLKVQSLSGKAKIAKR